MTHWLEEEEKIIGHQKDRKVRVKDKIIVKKDEIKLNRLEVENEYLAIIDQFESIIDRINDLPRESRKPFGQIFCKQKDNKLDNLLFKFHSSQRIISKEFASILRPFKSQHYKNTRSFFISIAREKGYILLEYKEIKAKRIKINDQLNSFWRRIPLLDSLFNKVSHDTKENIKTIPIKDFQKDEILNHIDWLAFKSKGTSFFLPKK